jgi:antitoxin component of MazEF toxin-antitoxin module
VRKEIKKYGNTNVIVLSSEDMKVYGLTTEDVIEFEIVKIEKEVEHGKK